jgi:transcriptional regulator with XRE-family HTH domain
MDLLSPRSPSRADLDIRERRRSRHNVARAIIDARVDLGLSQDELGRRAGTKQSRVSEIEAMKGNPRFDTLDRISRMLGLMIDLVPRRPVPAFQASVATSVQTSASGSGHPQRDAVIAEVMAY